MIEIELFQYEPNNKKHVLKIWINGNLSFETQITGIEELEELRNNLSNELLWLDKYLQRI